VPRHKRASGGLLNFRVFDLEFTKHTVERPNPIVRRLQHEIFPLASLWRGSGNSANGRVGPGAGRRGRISAQTMSEIAITIGAEIIGLRRNLL
jgi:hypothetical protein